MEAVESEFERLCESICSGVKSVFDIRCRDREGGDRKKGGRDGRDMRSGSRTCAEGPVLRLELRVEGLGRSTIRPNIDRLTSLNRRSTEARVWPFIRKCI